MTLPDINAGCGGIDAYLGSFSFINHIRYSKPISGKPHAVADLGALSGDLDRLARGRKARVQMQVEIFGDETPGAVFEGTYIVLPAKPFGPYEEGGNEEE